jgi:hypothetical protein
MRLARKIRVTDGWAERVPDHAFVEPELGKKTEGGG